jgi:phage tail-like protein
MPGNSGNYIGLAVEGASLLPENSFRVEVDGILLGDFDSVNVSGGEWTVVKKRRPGAGRQPMVPYAGQEDSYEITLKKTLLEGQQRDILEFWNWKQKGDSDRRTVTIIGHNMKGEEVSRHTYLDAWCVVCPPPSNFERHKDTIEGLSVEIKLTASEEKMEV